MNLSQRGTLDHRGVRVRSPKRVGPTRHTSLRSGSRTTVTSSSVSTASEASAVPFTEEQTFTLDPAPTQDDYKFIGGLYKFDNHWVSSGYTHKRVLNAIEVQINHKVSWWRGVEWYGDTGPHEAYAHWDGKTYGEPTPADMDNPGHSYIMLTAYMQKYTPAAVWVPMISLNTYADCKSLGWVTGPFDGTYDWTGTSGTNLWHDVDRGFTSGGLIYDAQLMTSCTHYGPNEHVNFRLSTDFLWPVPQVGFFGDPPGGSSGWQELLPSVDGKLTYYYTP